MSAYAAITVNRPRQDVEGRWSSSEDSSKYPGVAFADAPGDRGTEIRVDLEQAHGGGVLRKLRRSLSRDEAKEDLRRFKQLVETGVIARSDGGS